jgi:hypothetical protein
VTASVLNRTDVQNLCASSSKLEHRLDIDGIQLVSCWDDAWVSGVNTIHV